LTPRMIPGRYLADYKSGGEEYVFAELRAQAPDDWLVLHSLDIAPGDDRRRGEADFVVIVPGRGAAVLEVKSVARQQADRSWDYGAVSSPRSPFEQADTAMRSVMKYLDTRGFTRRPFFCSGVVTPFGDITSQSRDAKTIEWNEWQAIGQSQLRTTGLVGSIERLLTRERSAEERPTSEFSADAIAEALRPRFEFYVSPAARRLRRDEEIKRFTEEQFDALDDFDANDRLLVIGPAGCGKTLLALELVRRTVERGQTALLGCYSQMLGDWLEQQVAPLGYQANASRLESLMLRVAGLRMPNSPDPDFWSEELPLTAAERFSTVMEPFDVLVVDEAQDLLTSASLLFLNECVAGGIRDGRWVIFGDFENQRIQLASGTDAPSALLGEATGTRVFERRLRRNCRNTRSVASFAERIAQLPPEYAYRSCLRTDEGVAPMIIATNDPESSTEALAQTLSDLLNDGFRADEIVVLSMCATSASTAKRLADQPEWRSLLIDSKKSPGTGRIRFDTIRRFKGLEAPAVVLTDLQTVYDEADATRGLAYVGATRSVDRLVIVADADAARLLARGSSL